MTPAAIPAPLKRGLLPSHPGEILREVTLPALKAGHGVGKADFAERLGISRGMLEKIVTEASSVTPSLALRLATVLNTTPQFWMNLQTAYDLHKAALAMADQLAALKPVALAARKAA